MVDERNEIQVILAKYEDEESCVDQQLQESAEKLKRDESETKLVKRQNRLERTEKALNRNKKILKDLELVKSTLRSKAIYSPSEMQWDAICSSYKQSPSLQVTTWRCHMPVFV